MTLANLCMTLYGACVTIYSHDSYVLYTYRSCEAYTNILGFTNIYNTRCKSASKAQKVEKTKKSEIRMLY